MVSSWAITLELKLMIIRMWTRRRRETLIVCVEKRRKGTWEMNKKHQKWDNCIFESDQVASIWAKGNKCVFAGFKAFITHSGKFSYDASTSTYQKPSHQTTFIAFEFHWIFENFYLKKKKTVLSSFTWDSGERKRKWRKFNCWLSLLQLFLCPFSFTVCVFSVWM